MKLKSGIKLLALLFGAFACTEESGSDLPPAQDLSSLITAAPLDYVDPFIGTGGHGHTYPGASAPFGMVQLSPDTRLDGWDGCSGYHYTDDVIYGFSHTHLSGTGVSDYGDVLLMPTTAKASLHNGTEWPDSSGYSSHFDKDREVAQAGYYSTHLSDWGVDVELTATEHVGIHKYTYPTDKTAYLTLDLNHRDQLLDVDFEDISAREIVGKRISKAWATNQHVYFVIQFSQDVAPVKDLSSPLGGRMSGVWRVENTSEPLIVKVGISAVSIEGARRNLEAEAPEWDFNTYKVTTQAKWESSLNKINLKGGTDEQLTIFYTALYHSMLNPNLFSDVDGQYRGMDGEVHQLPAGQKQYTIFSLWDTFRATHPLFTIIERDRTVDFLRTFERQYQDGGKLPIWELAGNYTGCMIGYHAIPVIADAQVKGIEGFDAPLLYEAMKHSSNEDILGLPSYRRFGYIPAGDEPESVSKTLEYAYDDWCIAQMATSLGETNDITNYLERAQTYKNLYDPSTKFMRAKMDGSWFAPFDPSEVNYNYTEANAWQYSLFVPQDVTGLAELMGGFDQLEEHLDQLFTASSATTGRDQADITGLIGQYAHGNEPSHHMAYLYNYTGSPWKTQEKISQILDELYHAEPDGLSGNEDCGQMSSWYVLSAMGIYPVTPGSDVYAIGSPIFPEATINLENGKTFVIQASHASIENKYIQAATLNGEPLTRSFLQHGEIMAGGTLHFFMGSTPNKEWGVGEGNLPVSSIDDHKIVPAPYFIAESKTFYDSLTLELGTPLEGFEIHYATDEDPEFRLYEAPLTLHKNTLILARTVDPNTKGESSTIEENYFKIEGGRILTLNTEYANQYAAGGDNALIDYLRGSNNYRTGHWQGYQGQDLEAIIDLGSEQGVNRISTGFLQDIRSWVWYPTEVVYAISTDGVNYTEVGTVLPEFPDNQEGAFNKDFEVNFGTKNARYIRVQAKTYGKCPDWHLGAGGDTWLFADEIVVGTE